MRKVLSLLMVVVILLSLCACQQKEPNKSELEETSPEITVENTTVATEETAVPTVTVPATFTVELTPENFGDYFEMFFEPVFQEDAFGDISRVDFQWGIRLKEVYLPYLKNAENIVVEIISGHGFREYEIDNDNKAIEWSEIDTIGYEQDRYTRIAELSYIKDEQSVMSRFGLAVPSATRQAVKYPVEVGVLRAKGTLVFRNAEDFPATENKMPPAEKQSVETEEIELTTENWDTYFEFAEVPDFSENSFGEVDTFHLYYQFRLKEEYVERLKPDKSNVAIEVSYTYGDRYCNVDFENQSYELHKYEYTGESSKMGELSFHSDGGYYFADFGVNPQFNGNTVFSYSNFEILRIAGCLCLSRN